MNKTIRILLLSISIVTPISAFAEDQTITLKDGTVLKGELTEVSNGVYTVKTGSLGTTQINANQVASIANGNAVPTAQGATPVAAAPANSQTGAQMAQMQQAILGNPAAMADIQQIAQDPEIMKLISNPEILHAATTRDVGAMQNSAAAQELMNNPKMRALIERLRGNTSSNSSSSQ